MAFQLKDFTSIAASMMNYARATQGQLTDFSVGGVARTIMEAPAIEIEELYQRAFAGIMEAIPTAIYRGFDFAYGEATSASGFVTLTFAEPLDAVLNIPAGTTFSAPATGLSYLVGALVRVPIGSTTARIRVVCTRVGSVGNAGANSIQSVLNLALPVGTVIGNSSIVSGRDQETEEERKTRFAAYIKSLARGTPDSVVFAAMSAALYSGDGVVQERVARVGVAEEPGRFDVYIYGSAGAASGELITKAQKIIDGYYDDQGVPVPGYGPAGVNTTVRGMVDLPVDVLLNVRMRDGYLLGSSTRAAFRTAIEAQLALVPSGGVLAMSRITDACLAVSGVLAAWVDNQANLLCGAHQVLTLGQLDVVEVEG